MIMSEPAAYSLKWSGQGQTYADFLHLLHQQNDFSDVTLVCDGQAFPAHNLVLSSCSTFLSSLLTQSSTIFITMTNIYTLQSLLTFLYRGEISVGGQDDVKNLLSLARQLQISCLCKEEENVDDQEDSHCDGNPNIDHDYILQPKVDELNDECWSWGKSLSSHMETKTRNMEADSNVLSKNKDIIEVPDDNNDDLDQANTEMSGLESYTEQITFLTSFKMVKVCAGEGERPWHCLVCGKGFARKQYCKQHMEVHLEGIALPCLNCSKVFRSKTSLRDHKGHCKGKSLVVPEEMVEVVLEDMGGEN